MADRKIWLRARARLRQWRARTRAFSFDSTGIRARIGAVAGAVAIGIAAVFFARAGEWALALFHKLCPPGSLLPLALTPAAFVTVVWATRRWAPEARGSGIPQVIAASRNARSQVRRPLLTLQTGFAKLFGTLLMLAAGASVGREGPTVQVSAAIMVAMQRWLRVPLSAGIVIAGGAAGVAAAFNTPLAGVAFAIEELAAAFEQKLAVLVMATVMIGGLVSLGIAGDYVYFGSMTRALPLHQTLILTPVAGLLGGALGGAFARTLMALPTSQARWIRAIRARPLWLALGCGIVVAVAGLVSGGLSWGTGYAETRTLLSGGEVSVAFAPAKFVATLATAISGAPGGIFAPSLSVGAGLGQLLSMVFPQSSAGAIVLLGLIGYFTGVVRAPLTAVIIVMEMTADRTMILPLFATALIADQVSALVCPEKLYHALARGFE